MKNSNQNISLDNRIVQEIARIKAETRLTAAQMAAEICLLKADVIDWALRSLTTESGDASPKSFLNDGNGWNHSMNDAVRGLVASIHTVEGITFYTLADRDLFLSREEGAAQ